MVGIFAIINLPQAHAQTGPATGFPDALASAYLRAGQVQTDPATGFDDAQVAVVPSPTALAFTPDGRLLITSQLGKIYVYRNGVLIDPPALDFESSVCTYRERGISSIAVDPDFASTHFVYVSYTFHKPGSNCDAEYTSTPVGRISRFQLNDNDTIDPISERVLIDNIPSVIGVHNVADVEFGKDGYLYISVGDSGCDYTGESGCFESNDAAQDLTSLVGKVLRIKSDGTVPPDNPFTGPGTVRCQLTGGSEPGSACQEIFAFGLRNPWRITFDPNAPGARFFINDVGESTWEEIDEGKAGANYGWNWREGFCADGSTTDCGSQPDGLTAPLFAYDRSEGCTAVTGGAFVPQGVWPAEFQGTYLYGDYTCGQIFRLRPSAGTYIREPFMPGVDGSTIVDMLFGPENERTVLYYTSFRNGGEVRRIAYVGAANRPPTAAFDANPMFGPSPLTVAFDGHSSTDPDREPLTYTWTFGDDSPAASGVTSEHTYAANGTYTVGLTVTDAGGLTASATARIDVGNTPPAPVIVTPASDYAFAVGDRVVLQGRATDAEDGQLPDSSLTWRVIRHHNTHTHPFLPLTTGNNVAFTAPGPEDLGAGGTSWLEIELTAVDSAGLAKTITQALMPKTVRLDFISDPPGAKLRIDNDELTAPVSFTSWVNYGVAVEANSQTRPSGATLTFNSWSDGGAAAHTIISPSSPTTYTARFTTAPSSPFGGTAVSLPGTIEAENFDDGGVDIAYVDTTTVNSGGQYRQTGVDIESTTDVGGGYSIGYAVGGEWLAYTVNVASSDTYVVAVRVASNGPGGTFHIEVDGVDRTGPLAVPNTGGWQAWTTIRTAGIALSAGRQIWRLVMDTNGGTDAVGNFNWMSATVSGGGTSGGGSTPFGGTAVSLPGIIQAENFDEGAVDVAYVDTTAVNSGGQYREGGVDIESTTDAGGGYSIGYAVGGEWLAYTVNVASSDTYVVAVRVASNGPGGTFHIEVDGVDRTGPLAVPNTGGWQSWTTIRTAGIELNAGRQIWRLVMDTNGGTDAVGNFNWMSATVSGGGASGGGSTPFGGTAVPLPGTVETENFDDGGEGVAYHDLDPGNGGGQYRATDVDIEANTDPLNEPLGNYSLGWVFAGEWLNYTVNVQTSGTYNLTLRVASNGSGGTFHMEINGVDKTGPLTVPDTGGWNVWRTVSVPNVALNSGVQVWRLVMDENGSSAAVGNFNSIHVASTVSSPFAAVVLPGTIEAENFDNGGEGVAYHDLSVGNSGSAYRAGDVDIEGTADTGGFNVGWAFAGEWLKYTVQVAATDTYDFDIRVASNGGGGTFHIEVDGVDQTGPLTVPDTGGWQTWTTIQKTGVMLGNGFRSLRLVMDTDGESAAVGNFDYIRVVRRP